MQLGPSHSGETERAIEARSLAFSRSIAHRIRPNVLMGPPQQIIDTDVAPFQLARHTTAACLDIPSDRVDRCRGTGRDLARVALSVESTYSRNVVNRVRPYTSNTPSVRE